MRLDDRSDGRVEKQGRSVRFSRSGVWTGDECLPAMGAGMGTFTHPKADKA